MGGERASTTRQRESGKICWKCPAASIFPQRDENASVINAESTGRVIGCLCFMSRDGWTISFLEADCKTPLKRKPHFAKNRTKSSIWRGAGELT